jgi:protein TonB
MIAPKLIASKLNGWALSLLLHGGVALVAGLSVFTVQLDGGSGNGGTGGLGLAAKSYGATFRTSEDPVVSGTVLPDLAQYGRLSSEETPLESVAEELPTPVVPFDVFAVGSTETSEATPTPADLSDPQVSRPGACEGRAAKLPAGSTSGNGSEDSEGGAGSGGGNSSGNGSGEGSGEGNATGVYTPAPAYPSDARRRNIEGTVVVELAIAPDGSCAFNRMIESSGFESLDDAVQKTIRYWKYRTASDDGRAETAMKRVRFVFRLGK